MATGEMVRYAIVIAVFWASLIVPASGVVRRKVLTSDRSREIVFAVASAFCGVSGWDTAHRLTASHEAKAYLYVLGLPLATGAAVFLASRLGGWNSSVPIRPSRVAPAKSRVRARR
ncbi:hypothetical protein [Jatrophihabitans endophyticus]|uniref:hypothetical protein n=1 Tax=Jatrophihabitans endophyticus TaxID=1206085 RepID=UPI0019E79D05|nr:hypothetical protein [Jatrophihabitans endophyticus]MBE7189941.1 hypothetical protein [Jatrophihabitans endophyticus]